MPQSAPRPVTAFLAPLIALALFAVAALCAADEPRWGDGDGNAANELAARGNSDSAVVPAALAAARAAIGAAPRDPARYRAALTALHADAILIFWRADNPTHETIAAAVTARHEEAVAVGRAWAAALPGEESSLALADLLGQDAEAERVLRRLIDREPRSVAAHEAIVRWLRDAEREDDLTPLLEALAARDGAPPAAFRLLLDHYQYVSLWRSQRETIARWRQRFPQDRDAIREQLMRSGAKLERGEAAALGDRLLDAPAQTSAAEREALRLVCTSLLNAQLSAHYERCLRRLLAAASPDDTWLAVQDATQYADFLADEERWGELDAFIAAARPSDADSIARRMADSAAGYARAGRCALALQVLERARPAERAYDKALDVAETLTYCVSRERGTAELLAWAEMVGERDWMPYRLRVLPADPPFLAPFVELLEARLADDPLDAHLNEALAAVLEPFGDFPARLRHLSTWAALAPEKASVPMSIAQLLLGEGKHQAAAAAYAEVVAKSPENAEAWTGLVEAQLAAGLEEEAARSAEAAAAAGERVSTRLVALAAESRQSWRQAADAWARHLALVPASEILRPDEDRYLAVLKRLGDVEGVESWLAARAPLASNLTSTNAEAWLGDAWRRLGFAARARQHYEAALVADPDDDAVVYGLAQAAADEGRKEEAAVLYRRALARNPAEGGRALAVARYLREQGDAKGAIAAIRPAADAENNGMSWIRVELVRDLRAAGDDAAALALADRLLAENEHANLVRFERGEALAALGRDAEARATFDDFLERTAAFAAKGSSCNCNCEVLSVRAELLARLQPTQGGDAAVAATPTAPP